MVYPIPSDNSRILNLGPGDSHDLNEWVPDKMNGSKTKKWLKGVDFQELFIICNMKHYFSAYVELNYSN